MMRRAIVIMVLTSLWYCAHTQSLDELQPKDLPAFHGIVVEKNSYIPIKGATIVVLGTKKKGISGKEGKFQILNIPAGYYSIRVTHPAYRSRVLNHVQFIEQSSIHFVFNLSKGSSSNPPEISECQLNIQDTTYFTNVEQPPELIEPMPPIPYPELAQRSGLQGTVWLDVFINEQGTVDKATVAKGIGGGCDESAMEIAKKLRFVPAKQQGKAVKARINIPFRFKLTAVGQGFGFNLDESPVSETELERLLNVLNVTLERFTYMVPFRHRLKRTLEEYEDGRRTERQFGSGFSTRSAGKHTLSILVQKLEGNKVQLQFLSPQGNSSISGIALKSYGATKIAGLRNARLAEHVKTPILVYAMNPRPLDKTPPEGTFEYYLAKYKFVIVVVMELEKIE